MKERNDKAFGFWKKVWFALSGLQQTFKSEMSFRIHVISMIGVVTLGILLSLSLLEWFWIFLAVALVMAMELINTSIESLADFVSLTFQPLIKKAKDASAAAVLIVSIFALLIGFFVFIPKLWALFN